MRKRNYHTPVSYSLPSKQLFAACMFIAFMLCILTAESKDSQDSIPNEERTSKWEDLVFAWSNTEDRNNQESDRQVETMQESQINYERQYETY